MKFPTDFIHRQLDKLAPVNQTIVYWAVGGAMLGILPGLSGFTAHAVWAFTAVMLVADRWNWMDVRSKI